MHPPSYELGSYLRPGLILPGESPSPDVLGPTSRTTFTELAMAVGAGAGSTGCPPRAPALGLGIPVSGLTPQGSCVVLLSDASLFSVGSLALTASFDGCHPVRNSGAEEGG